MHHPLDEFQLDGRGVARLAVVNGQHAEDFPLAVMDRRGPAGAQAVLERELAVTRPQRVAGDVLHDHLPVQRNRRRAGRDLGTNDQTLKAAPECLRQAGAGAEPQVDAVLIEQHDRADRSLQLIIQAKHQIAQHLAQRLGADDRFHGAFLPCQKLLGMPAGGDVHHQGGDSGAGALVVDERRVIPLAEDLAAVLADVLVGASFAAAAVDQVLPDFIQTRMKFLRHDKGRGLPGSLLGAVSENRLCRGIPAADPGIHVPLDDGHRGLLEVQSELLGGHPQRFLCLLALGDVGVRDDDAADVARGPDHFHGEPARAPRRVARVFQIEMCFLARQHGFHPGDGGLRVWIADMDGRSADFQIVRAHADFLLAGVAVFAGEAQPRFVDRKDFPRLVQHHDVRGQGVEDGPLELLALAQRFLGLFEPGDVEGGAHQAGDGPVSIAQRHFVDQ